MLSAFLFVVAFWVFLTHSLAYPIPRDVLAREMWLLLLIYFNWIETATRPPISISDMLPRILWAYLYQPVGQACETVCLADLFGVDVMEQCPDKRTMVVMLDVLHGMESRWRSPTQMYWIDLHEPFTGALSTSKSCNWIHAYIMCRLYQHDSDSGCTAIVHQHCCCIREMVRWTWFERDVNDRKKKCMVLYHASHHSTWAVQTEIENATVATVLRSAELCIFMHV